MPTTCVGQTRQQVGIVVCETHFGYCYVLTVTIMAAKVSLMCLIAHIFKNPEPVTKLVAHFIVGLILKSAVNFVFYFRQMCGS